MIPQSRQDFKSFCLRQLGAPVIKINLSEDQIDDCVDQALYLYGEYHFDGSNKQYYKYQLTNTDIANGYITMPENTIGVIKIFPVGQSIGTNSLFNMRYQFIINDLYNFSNVSLVPYYMMMSHIQMMEEMLIGQKPIRYTRHENILYLDMDMSVVTANQWLIAECQMIIDPSIFADVWRDKWLQEYATAIMKRQWGNVLSIYDVPMPGNMKINGQKVYADGVREVEKLEAQLLQNFTAPPMMITG